MFFWVLISLGGIDWFKVILFYLDEYLGIFADYFVSFCYYF